MKQHKNNPLVPMLILAGLILAIIGCRTAWIDLPLSGSFPGSMDELLSLRKVIETFRSAFLATIVLASICGLLRYRLVSMQISFVSLLILLGFVVYSLFNESQWVVTYINQSQQQLALQSFISNYYWPNLNPDYAVGQLNSFQYLWERLLLSWHIIGVGFKVAMTGVIVLFVAGLIQQPATPKFNLFARLILLAGVLFVLWPLFRADYIHRQGDTLFSESKFQPALEAYEAAFQRDPMLEYSTPFLTKVSHLYYRLEGEHSVFSGLYMLNATVRNGQLHTINPVLIKKLATTRLMIENNSHKSSNYSVLQTALIEQANKRDAELWAQQGLLEYKDGLYEQSISSFQQALKGEGDNVDVKFFMADALSKLHRYEDSLVILKSALNIVWTKQLRADLQCTIGDVYEKLEKPLLARESYIKCYELDSVYNYRAVKNLGGT